MNQTAAFIGGCILTGILIVLLLMGWIVFGKSSPDYRTEAPKASPSPSITFSPSPKVYPSPSPLVTVSPQPLPPPPISVPSVPDFKDYQLEQQIKNQSEQQRSAYEQLKTQLQQQLLDMRQLKTQLEQQWAETQQLRLQQDQLKLQNDRLLIQVQEQERLISGLSLQQGIDNYSRRASGSSANYLEKGILWFIGGIVLAILLLGGGIILVGMIILLAQPQRRSSYNGKSTAHDINVPWQYTIYEEEETKFLPPYIDRKRKQK
ncbi:MULTISPECIES: hypothetical protein [Okeania]|nr:MULTISPECIES: hypothetical protein [Okeania]NES75624.1 hypothetical protein [Okeania sp. SIO1H4]NES87848.1 hypothetical protein [Okeania sp. SIO2B9]NET19031.1 hypothetical protein [Okeania sp. SIO1H5]NET75352.1 hypothetical protein [Okeania sp. SIO1F9]NET91895.1 hypothetical protein [Okeania sp. SIO1H2]